MEVKLKPFLHPEWIDPQAIDIVRRLQSKGHTSYLVGGCIRDLLCGIVPKDYDIATSAVPNQVKRIVFGSYVIGRRFRLVLVKRGDLQFEVATFRRPGTLEDLSEGSEDALMGENFFGTPEEDALRRDFTINALFYDPVKDQLIDFAEAKTDIDQRILRMIGDPTERIKEDPIRTLRAIRFAHKLNFAIEPSLRQAIQEQAELVGGTILPRRREEFLKIFRLKDPAGAFLEMYDLGILKHALPGLIPIFEDPEKQDIFLNYIGRISEFAKDSPRTSDLYLPVILGYRHALGLEALPTSVETPADLRTLGDREEEFLRLELGIFRSEYGEIVSLFETVDRLKEIDLFNRRGARRQQAFLENPLLTQALRLADFEHLLTPDTRLFWRMKFQESGLLD